MRFPTSLLGGLALLSTSAFAQSSAWQQCGGIGFSGSTSCVSGYTCIKLNDYYSQCQPGAAPSATTVKSSTATVSTSAKPSTTTLTTSTKIASSTSSKAAPSSSTSSKAATPTSYNLIASHYTGKLYSLSYKSSGSNGTLAVAGFVSGCGNMPSWLQLDSGTLLCTDESGNSGVVSTISASSSGALAQSGTVKTAGGDVHGNFYGGTDGEGFVVLAEYNAGMISTYALPLTSSSQPLQKLTFTGSGPVTSRQTSAHPHSAIADPTGAFLIVPDLGSDLIRIFSINNSTGTLTACTPAKANSGDGPRHGAWWTSSSGRTMLYTVNELSNTASSWTVSYPSSSSGCLVLTKQQTLSTYAAGKAPASSQTTSYLPAKAAEVHVSGNYLYAANRNDQTFGSQQDSLATYSIDASSGLLTFVENTNAHAWYPRTFQINKAGTLVAVGGQTSSNVAVIARDVASGRLGNFLATIQIATPGTNGGEDGLSAVIWDE